MGADEFAQTVYMCSVVVGNVFVHVPRGNLMGRALGLWCGGSLQNGLLGTCLTSVRVSSALPEDFF